MTFLSPPSPLSLSLSLSLCLSHSVPLTLLHSLSLKQASTHVEHTNSKFVLNKVAFVENLSDFKNPNNRINTLANKTKLGRFCKIKYQTGGQK